MIQHGSNGTSMATTGSMLSVVEPVVCNVEEKPVRSVRRTRHADSRRHAHRTGWTSKLELPRFQRYVAVGGAATAMHYVLLLMLTEWLAVSPPFATAFGAFMGAILAYVGNRRFTFAASDRRHSRALPRFLLVAAAIAWLNGSLVWALSSVFTVHYLFAQAAATVLLLGITYRINKMWTFK